MREIPQRQLLLQPALPEHLHLKELEEMSKGLRGDQVIRAAILYHSKGWSFETLAFELRYHTAYRWFCLLDRETHYGHKICLSTAPSNLITDCMILDGNPRDSELAIGRMKRHKEQFGYPPEQAAFDGGFATKDNLSALKAMGIKDVMFSKRVGLAISDMVRDSWAYKQLRNFRAGIEGVISFLKRAFGLRRCRFQGLPSFKSYVHGSIVAANLLIFARHNLA
jgi:hypothetical protein